MEIDLKVLVCLCHKFVSAAARMAWSDRSRESWDMFQRFGGQLRTSPVGEADLVLYAVITESYASILLQERDDFLGVGHRPNP